MRVITQYGRPIKSPPPTDLDLLLLEIQETPFHQLREITRLRLKLELELSHHEREAIRFRRFTEEATQ